MKTIVVWPKIISHTTIVFKNWSVLAINLLPFRKCCLTIYNNKRYRIHITNGTVCSSISLFFSFVRLFQSYISYGSFITQLCGIFYFCYKILFLMFFSTPFSPLCFWSFFLILCAFQSVNLFSPLLISQVPPVVDWRSGLWWYSIPYIICSITCQISNWSLWSWKYLSKQWHWKGRWDSNFW